MEVTVRLTVRKDRTYTKTPHFKTIHHPAAHSGYCTTGIDSDIREATRAAVRNMIQFLVAEYEMDRVAAYMLCSVAGDLKMHEVVSPICTLCKSATYNLAIFRLICQTML